MKEVRVVGAAIIEGDRCLVAQRGPRTSAANKWEFPGGKLEPGEAPQEALRREISEELGLSVSVGAWLGRGSAEAGDVLIRLDVFAAEVKSGVLELREHSDARWLKADALPELDWARADLPLIPLVQRHLEVRATRPEGCGG